jgi:non-canonical (house-cleaning) NTP pyrophosphatase
MPEELSQSKVPETLEEFRESEKIVDPPRNGKIPDIQRQDWPLSGKDCLVIFTTKNEDKVRVLETHFKDNKPDDIDKYFFLQIPVEDNGCSQPCNGQGYVCARHRITQAIDIFRDNYTTYLKDKEIGTIIVAAIESFFERDNVPKPVDAAVIGIFNVSTGKMATATSRGVTLHPWFLEEAERQGGIADNNKDCLRITAGEMVAKRFPGVNKADWHKEAVNKPRREFLEETIKEMEVPWA